MARKLCLPGPLSSVVEGFLPPGEGNDRLKQHVTRPAQGARSTASLSRGCRLRRRRVGIGGVAVISTVSSLTYEVGYRAMVFLVIERGLLSSLSRFL